MNPMSDELSICHFPPPNPQTRRHLGLIHWLHLAPNNKYWFPGFGVLKVKVYKAWLSLFKSPAACEICSDTLKVAIRLRI